MATEAQEKKTGKVLGEFKAGTLKSSTGATVTEKKQAVAIALSEAGLARKQSPPVIDLDEPATMDKLMDWNRHEVMEDEPSFNPPGLVPMTVPLMPPPVVPPIMQQIAATPKQVSGPSINDVIANARREQ